MIPKLDVLAAVIDFQLPSPDWGTPSTMRREDVEERDAPAFVLAI